MLLACTPLVACEVHSQSKMPHNLMLANVFQGQRLTSDHWVSEKLDGIRAVWNGKQLMTRNGTVIHAPIGFTEQLPDFSVEGELWVGRGRYVQVQQTVLDHTPNERAWADIHYVLFSRIDTLGSYEQGYHALLQWKAQQGENSPQVTVIKQRPFQSYRQLNKELNQVVASGGEGLMVRHRHGVYIEGRSDNLLKIKPHQDAEARVVGYKQGKKPAQIGSLWVETAQGVRFYIGSGLSDQQRKNPPAIGTVITYRYNGTTHNGVPKFARFMRERPVF
ncbi:DNA ligase [Vibrio rarus]|uniref:DNA ligase n=1 Tax=Vibrio rarus TaxID=413403 RepID=UPI0021C4A131|nr:DNA ligase [Vibrio rarus]